MGFRVFGLELYLKRIDMGEDPEGAGHVLPVPSIRRYEVLRLTSSSGEGGEITHGEPVFRWKIKYPDKWQTKFKRTNALSDLELDNEINLRNGGRSKSTSSRALTYTY